MQDAPFHTNILLPSTLRWRPG